MRLSGGLTSLTTPVIEVTKMGQNYPLCLIIYVFNPVPELCRNGKSAFVTVYDAIELLKLI